MKIGQIKHPRHGLYFIWCDSHGLYGITREDKAPHCAYASLAEMLKWKGL